MNVLFHTDVFNHMYVYLDGVIWYPQFYNRFFFFHLEIECGQSQIIFFFNLHKRFLEYLKILIVKFEKKITQIVEV